eukprot:scaffold211910_cov13-Tisochrysis_lutea.AAC.1
MPAGMSCQYYTFVRGHEAGMPGCQNAHLGQQHRSHFKQGIVTRRRHPPPKTSFLLFSYMFQGPGDTNA